MQLTQRKQPVGLWEVRVMMLQPNHDLLHGDYTSMLSEENQDVNELMDILELDTAVMPHEHAEAGFTHRQLMPLLVVEHLQGDGFLATCASVDGKPVYRLYLEGHVREDESLEEAADRILMEKTGVDGENLGYVNSGLIHSESTPFERVHLGCVVHLFLEEKPESLLCSDSVAHKWLPLREIAQLYGAGYLDHWSNIIFCSALPDLRQFFRDEYLKACEVIDEGLAQDADWGDDG